MQILGVAGLDARCRRALGQLADALCQRKAWQHLGFARLSDWSRERLGICASELRAIAAVSRRLAPFPVIEAAYGCGQISWTKARALTSVKKLTHPELWLEEALASSGRGLEAKVRALNEGVRIENIPFVNRELIAALKRSRDVAVSFARDAEAMRRCNFQDKFDFSEARREVEAEADDKAIYEQWWNETATVRMIDGEPELRMTVPCTETTQLLWLEACEFAQRMIGRDAPVWDLVEAMCMEATSCPSIDLKTLDRLERIRAQDDRAPQVDETLLQLEKWGRERAPAGDCRDTKPCKKPAPRAAAADPDDSDPYLAALPGNLRQLFAERALMTCHPARLDRRMCKVVGVMQSADARLGSLLNQHSQSGFYRYLGYATLEEYAHGCLGICARKLRDLLQVARDSSRYGSGVFEAYRTGRLTRAKLSALKPVLRGAYAKEWVERAGQVTHRRLRQELEYAKARAHLEGRCTIAAPPPSHTNLNPIWEELRAHDEACRRARDAEASRQTRSAACEEADPEADWWQAPGAAGGAGADFEGTSRQMRSADGGDSEDDSRQRRGDAGNDGGLEGESRQTRGGVGDEDGPEADPRQMRSAGPRPRVVSAPMPCTISFVGPAKLVQWFYDIQTCFLRLGERRGDALRRLLEEVLNEWRGQPGHPDPVFARDGWRCSVPGCTARAMLHDHHVIFRSRGGKHQLWNRLPLCIWHHQRAVHAYTINAYGRAPDGIHWEIGFKANGEPILRLFGEYYEREPSAAARQHAA